MKFYKIRPESEYAKDLAKAKESRKAIVQVSEDLRKEFDLPESKYASFSNINFYQPPEATPEAYKKQFKMDGFAKKNSAVYKRFQELIKERDLSEVTEERFINFSYGIMRTSSEQKLARYAFEGVDYIETDVPLGKSELRHLEEVKESEFREAYLEAVKRDEERRLAKDL